jgi:hypothetical protein
VPRAGTSDHILRMSRGATPAERVRGSPDTTPRLVVEVAYRDRVRAGVAGVVRRLLVRAAA